MKAMRILPVLDLMNGVVVRGVRGRRGEYRPIVGQLTRSIEPLDVASMFKEQFGLNELYLADLDAIAGAKPSLSIIAQLLDRSFRLWVDAGIGVGLRHVRALADAGVQHIIAGLESLDGPAQMQELIDIHGSSRLVFSLDMLNGKPLAKATWNQAEPWDIAETVVRLGVQRMLVLDLGAVGANQGPPTAGLCARLRQAFPTLEITTGGGIRDTGDLRLLQQTGIDHALVASALHDRRLTADEVRDFLADASG
jgi:phosphoribosylformimino-5-aminoimidazole carboxamide ribotide isomerase